ncbi:hypothetical protein ACTVZO_22090 [Streptomyces sp. IBSNAI002]|uniref:hypothetical protein n=1 Tax=Streptomyces sp. IBSNAI002 TaxID=3457500 RepID=UPI003FD33EDC
MAWLKADQVEWARRCHQETAPFRGVIPAVILCAKPVHAGDIFHVGRIRGVPPDKGGGNILLAWRKRDVLIFHDSRLAALRV